MKGIEKRVANESPPDGPYIIRTGFHLDDERTGRRFELLSCSVDQTGPSWLEEETAIGNRNRLPCRREDDELLSTILGETHQKTHAVISLREAAEWGVLDVADGAVLIDTDDVLSTLASRPARKAS
jgi:hypothetical protein